MDILIKTLLFLTNSFRITRFEEEIDQSRVFNRTNVLILEAKRRGIEIEVLKFFSFQTRFFKASHNGQKIFFESLPLGSSYQKIRQEIAENKWLTKNHLKKHSLPTPEGRVFKNHKKALKYAKELGFPLVCKPVSGSLSQNVIFNIKDEEKLKKAIKHAKEYERTFLIERHLEGFNFRILVVGGKIVGGVLRLPPSIRGNGKHSIKELVEMKNSHPKRGEREQRDTTLHKVILDKKAEEILKEQGFEPNSIPQKGKKVFLHQKVSALYGADIIDVTEEIHPENQELFKKVAEVFDAQILGIDFIAPFIKKSYKEQTCGIIEVNTLPYIDLHHHPLKGRPRDAASAILDLIFPSTKY